MAFDLAQLTYTPDLRGVQPVHARLVCAMRYLHISRKLREYSHAGLVRHLGSCCAVQSFHVFMDEAGRAWPDPIVLNPQCQPAFSYDEMLLVDLCTASAQNNRDCFDDLVRDMIGPGQRMAIWSASRRLMGQLATIVR